MPTDADASVRGPNLSDSERHAFLRDEYLLLQNQYEDIDRRSLTIKGWMGSGSVAALALAFNASSEGKLAIPVFTALMAAVFWWHEAKWKLFQHGFAYRIRVLEAYFRNDPDRLEKAAPDPFQAYHGWFEGYAHDPAVFPYEVEQERRARSYWKRLRKAADPSFVWPLYVTVIVLSLVSLAVSWTHR